MKTLHVVYSFPPDPPGGTEVYVEALAAGLQRRGVAAVVAAPAESAGSYRHHGLEVRRFVTSQSTLRVEDLYGRGDDTAADAFDRLLDEERPDLVHQHALTAACSVQLIERAKRRQLPVVFTYHTPTVTCQRGSLLEGGAAVCDGRLDESRCAACSLQGHGVGVRASRALSRMPEFVSALADRADLSGGPWTAIRMRDLTRRRISALETLFRDVDQFVALAPWVRSLLRVNGVPDGRIVDSPHGLAGASITRSGIRPERPAAGRLRVAHLGRIDPLKGTELLVRAVLGMPDAPIDLDVFGVVQDRAEAARLGGLTVAAQDDSRIRFRPPVPHEDIVKTLAGYHVVAVPSQWMETGPLVVLEAFAAGVPVLGSRLGGIADKVSDDVDGLLVSPYDDADAWRVALGRLVSNSDLVARLAAGVGPVRSFDEVVEDMEAVYAGLLKPAAAHRLDRRGGVAASRP